MNSPHIWSDDAKFHIFGWTDKKFNIFGWTDEKFHISGQMMQNFIFLDRLYDVCRQLVTES